MEELTISESKTIPGLYYIPGCISKEQMEDLIEQLDDEEWIPITSSQNSRKVQHYGYSYVYMTGQPGGKTHPFPKFLHFLRDMLKQICVLEGIVEEDYEFNQCIINNYESGQGISAHIDNKDYGHTIGCFTIGSPAEMTFSKTILCGGKSKIKKVNIYPLSGSLYIMSGECRKEWTHCMVGRKSDPSLSDGGRIKRGRRISITFRKVVSR